MGLALIETEEFDGWESFDIVRSTYALISGHIYGTNVYYTLKSLGNLLPSTFHCLAVTTPGSIELDKPELV
eukprot:CAMPEP_0116877608 /NCGR_PEP_ID=MMETSP0463-20121206/9373_1 /TAXON_ID=181622 /ORGANISM="Strombidinopsis sp, Strain SopsisLIS2011" /LENGTH=70 /DNA_ID=CAMNT_0004525029 /DNA_START=1043 /DNA_END=1255 /DNA_ORIENTATION=+